MRCPICSSKAQQIWESTGGVNGGCWFTGLYSCPECGHFKASGTIRKGERRLIQWHPGCPTHGTDPVHLANTDEGHDTEWVCSSCARRMTVSGGKLITTWQPFQPCRLEPSGVDEAMRRLGGLPHD